MNTVYVIGNGFDIDLGLKTRYSDFANSEYWPFKPKGGRYTSPLAMYLNYHKDIDKWLDLENLLGTYAEDASAKGGITIEKDKSDFYKLKKSFSDYLSSITLDPALIEDSTAALLLKHFISKKLSEDRLFSFNYTNLKLFAVKCSINSFFLYSHIHGSLNKDNIVLGFGDNVKDIKGYNFMRKSFDPGYMPPNIINQLMNSSTAVFYGVSMGDIDYAYFDAYFKAVSDPDNENMLDKRIFIFTYDENSREEILENILVKTNYRLSNLRVRNVFSIITVKDTPKNTIANIINGI